MVATLSKGEKKKIWSSGFKIFSKRSSGDNRGWSTGIIHKYLPGFKLQGREYS